MKCDCLKHFKRLDWLHLESELGLQLESELAKCQVFGCLRICACHKMQIVWSWQRARERREGLEKFSLLSFAVVKCPNKEEARGGRGGAAAAAGDEHAEECEKAAANSWHKFAFGYCCWQSPFVLLVNAPAALYQRLPHAAAWKLTHLTTICKRFEDFTQTH